MPKYTPSEDDMDNTYGGEVKPPSESSSSTESVDEENAGAAEILVAKNKLPTGTKEGDTCTFRVSKDFGDEFSLEYVKEAGEPEGEVTNESMNAEAESEIAALDTGE